MWGLLHLQKNSRKQLKPRSQAILVSFLCPDYFARTRIFRRSFKLHYVWPHNRPIAHIHRKELPMTTVASKSLTLRLMCKSMPETPAAEGILDVGIQDKHQIVHAGREGKDGARYFECSVEARIDNLTKGLDFRGPFVQGTPQGRFLYLSWKRKTASAAPWYWRIKIPLSGITERDVSSLKANEVLMTDITGRRPHSSETIAWKRSVASEV